MSISLENALNQKLVKIFASLGLDNKFAFVKVSDRPDLSDFQCNGALALAKAERKNPREIATNIAGELSKDPDLAKVSVDGPGFINITLNDEFIAKNMDEVAYIRFASVYREFQDLETFLAELKKLRGKKK